MGGQPDGLPVNSYVFHTPLPYSFNPSRRIPHISALFQPSKRNDPAQLRRILDRHDRLEEVIEHIASSDASAEPQPVTLAVAAARQRDADEYGMKNGILMLVTLLAVQPEREPYPVKMRVRKTSSEWEMKPGELSFTLPVARAELTVSRYAGDVIGVRYHLHWTIECDPIPSSTPASPSTSSSSSSSPKSKPVPTDKTSALVMISVWDLSYRGLVVDVSGFDRSRLTIESEAGSPVVQRAKSPTPDERRRLRSRSQSRTRSRTVSVSMTDSPASLPPSRAKTPDISTRTGTPSRQRRATMSRTSSRAGHRSGSSLSEIDEASHTLAESQSIDIASRPTSPDLRPGSRARSRTRSTRVSISMSEYLPGRESGRAKSPDGRPRPRTRRTVSMVVSDVEKTSDSRSHSSRSDEFEPDQSRAPSPVTMRKSTSPRGSASGFRPSHNRARTMTDVSGSDRSIEPLRYTGAGERVHFPDVGPLPPRHSRRATSPGPGGAERTQSRSLSRSRARRTRVSMLAGDSEDGHGLTMSLGAAGQKV